MAFDKSEQAKQQKRDRRTGQFVGQHRPKADTAEAPLVDLSSHTPPSRIRAPQDFPTHGPEWLRAQTDDWLISNAAGESASDVDRQVIQATVSHIADAFERVLADDELVSQFESEAEKVASRHFHAYLGGYFDDPFEVPNYWRGEDVLAETVVAMAPKFEQAWGDASCEMTRVSASAQDACIDFSVAAASSDREGPTRWSDLPGREFVVETGRAWARSRKGETLLVLFGRGTPPEEPAAMSAARFTCQLPIEKVSAIRENRWDDAFGGLYDSVQAIYS